MAMIEKGLTEKQPVVATRAVSEEPVAQPSVPRSTLNIADWDNIKRASNDGERESWYIPPHLIPDGFSVEWKRVEILGKPDKKNIVQVESGGWRPAPAEIFKDILPSGYSNPFVENGAGDMLYIRPLKFTEESQKEAHNIAVKKVKDYEEATMNRVTGHRDVPNKVHAFSRSYEKSNIPVPD